jgi:hypothetical protein
VGKRSRRRGDAAPLEAPTSSYASPDGEHVLELRGVLTPATRREYAGLAAKAAATREDLWQRQVEFLFERLAVGWSTAGTEALTGQKDLLARFRFASADERRWIRDALREHLTEWFPDVEAP